MAINRFNDNLGKGDTNTPRQPVSVSDGLRLIADFIDYTNTRFKKVDDEIAELKRDFDDIQKDITKDKFYKVTEFAKLHNIILKYKQSIELGQKAIKYCDDNRYTINREPGTVVDTFINSYPYDVLKTVFEDYFGIKL